MQVTVTVRTVEQSFAGGTIGGNWHIEFADASDPATPIDSYDGAAPSTNFDMTEGATVVIRGVRYDAGGAVLGPIATLQYTVGSDLTPIDVAASISAVASPGTRHAKK